MGVKVRGMVAARIANLQHAGNPKLSPIGPIEPISQSDAARTVSVKVRDYQGRAVLIF